MATQEFIITLPDDMADLVRSKVATGEYDSPSDVVQDGLEALREDEAALPSGPAWDRWVSEELLPSLAQYEADPASGIPIDVVRAELAERRERRLGRT